MKTRKFSTSASIITILLLVTGLMSGADATEKADPQDTVLSFNSLLTDGDANAAVAKLAAGGAQFVLRSLHEGVNPETLTADIVKHWSTIAPVVIASTSTYSRQVEIIDAEVHGDVATVWTQTSTEAVALNSDQKKTNSFTEVYLLIATADGWKIAAIADNRQTTKL